MDNPVHFRDVAVLASWFMMREIELSAARAGHLTLEAGFILWVIPRHKTDTQGSLLSRSLQCACSVSQLMLCPWHAGERHLLRLHNRKDFTSSSTFPGRDMPSEIAATCGRTYATS